MTFSYVVQGGDFLVKIAKKFGIPSWQEIYQHPENAAFRAKRPNPDRIFPGDVLRIPVVFTAATNLLQTNRLPAPIIDPRNPKNVTTQSALLAQFRWGATVTMRPVGGDFEVGFIQNIVEFKADCIYKAGSADGSPL